MTWSFVGGVEHGVTETCLGLHYMHSVISASSFACRFFNINIPWDLRKSTDNFSKMEARNFLKGPGDAEYLEAFRKVASRAQSFKDNQSTAIIKRNHRVGSANSLGRCPSNRYMFLANLAFRQGVKGRAWKLRKVRTEI